MEIKRDLYLEKIKSLMWNGQVKVITGIRRCGKSYLLNPIFYKYLLSIGVKSENIISIQLDKTKDLRYRNPLFLASYVHELVEEKKEQFYLFIDEIQMSDEIENPYNKQGKKVTFYDALNDLRSLSNLDIYVTGSNSRMLSSDILTEFRGRSDEIRVYPLSFREFYSAVGGDKNDAFEEYAFYGGMPFVLSKRNEDDKVDYLKSLFATVYIKDIVERRKIKREDILSLILDLLSSSVGSLTNPNKITSAMNSRQKLKGDDFVSVNTVKSYIDSILDAYLFEECRRYDVKGKNYFDYPNKYYCVDIGLRNARIGFRQQEMTHIMENIVYNELRIRGFELDVGIVSCSELNSSGRSAMKNREIDFIASKGKRKVYIQSTYAMETEEKERDENKPLLHTGDMFEKMIVRHDTSKSWYNEKGILNIGIIDFLLDDKLLQ